MNSAILVYVYQVFLTKKTSSNLSSNEISVVRQHYYLWPYPGLSGYRVTGYNNRRPSNQITGMARTGLPPTIITFISDSRLPGTGVCDYTRFARTLFIELIIVDVSNLGLNGCFPVLEVLRLVERFLVDVLPIIKSITYNYAFYNIGTRIALMFFM